MAGMAQTRTVAPASGIPRELKTMSSLRVPCARVGTTAPGQMCSASATNAQKNVILMARHKPDWAGRYGAIFDRIMRDLFCSTGTLACALFASLGPDWRAQPRLQCYCSLRAVMVTWTMSVVTVVGYAPGEFRAAACEGFQLPVIHRGSLHRHVVAGVSGLAVGEDLNHLVAWQQAGDGGEVHGVAAGRVIARKGERPNGVEQVAAGTVFVAR